MAYIGKNREPAFQFYADPTTIELAKKLRRKMTPYEKILWQRLRANKIAGLKFRRQHPVKFHIADFIVTRRGWCLRWMVQYITERIVASMINSEME
ncbi:MAG: DUF559 domain-containing protein [Bacteroidota bacterium]